MAPIQGSIKDRQVPCDEPRTDEALKILVNIASSLCDPLPFPWSFALYFASLTATHAHQQRSESLHRAYRCPGFWVRAPNSCPNSGGLSACAVDRCDRMLAAGVTRRLLTSVPSCKQPRLWLACLPTAWRSTGPRLPSKSWTAIGSNRGDSRRTLACIGVSAAVLHKATGPRHCPTSCEMHAELQTKLYAVLSRTRRVAKLPDPANTRSSEEKLSLA